jgi:archaellum component FlaD/FlaE
VGGVRKMENLADVQYFYVDIGWVGGSVRKQSKNVLTEYRDGPYEAKIFERKKIYCRDT